MSKFAGFSALSSWLRYVRDNAAVLYLDINSATESSSGNKVVSANISAADFTIASCPQGAVMTIGAKNNQPIEFSGNVTHLKITASTAGIGTFLLMTTVSAQILASGNTVNIASWTVTANQSANNA